MNNLDKQYTDLLQDIQNQIIIVRGEIEKRYPGGRYTICINIWDDDTTFVECRHATEEEIICSSRYYNNELTYDEYESTGTVMVKDGKGIEKLKYLRDE